MWLKDLESRAHGCSPAMGSVMLGRFVQEVVGRIPTEHPLDTVFFTGCLLELHRLLVDLLRKEPLKPDLIDRSQASFEPIDMLFRIFNHMLQ